MFDLKRVQEEFNKVCADAGIKVAVPVTLNGRLTRTLGRVVFNKCGSYATATKVEFSKQLLETASDKSIIDVIKHEAAHYIILERTHENHGHDILFKAVCAEIGTTNDKTKTSVERTVSSHAIYKYQVYCEDCKDFIGNYSRMNNTLKNLKYCSCKRCGKGNLSMIQNW